MYVNIIFMGLLYVITAYTDYSDLIIQNSYDTIISRPKNVTLTLMVCIMQALIHV